MRNRGDKILFPFVLCNSSAREDIWMKIVLARIFIRVSSLRERPIINKTESFVCKGSCEAAESAAGATLRMARLNCKDVLAIRTIL